MIRQEIKKALGVGEAEVIRSANNQFGDYSTNYALKQAKKEGKNPFDLASEISEKIKDGLGPESIFEKIEVAKPGFINFTLSPEFLRRQVNEILEQKENYGQGNFGRDQKIQVEFLDGNPTGPLTVANGRTGFFGDVLSNVLEKAGWRVEREYWVNNTGHQVEVLGHSILGDEKSAYRGEYIEKFKKEIKTAGRTPLEIGEEAAMIILEKLIKPVVKEKMRIKFDNWSLEKELHTKNQIKKVLAYLADKDLTYEKDGAWWFKSTQFGDEKDRVLITSKEKEKSEEPTYFAADIAYHQTKIERGYKKLINIWGADHHGYIKRLKAAVVALGFEGSLDIIIMQLVKLFQDGQEMRMSKRAGTFVTVEELIDDVGLDAARFFFLMYSADKQVDFDLGLAKERSQKNPVFYVQYAHARICSIFVKLKIKSSKLKVAAQNLKFLEDKTELTLIKQLIHFSEIVEDIASDYQVHRLPQYAMGLVRAFHRFYEECRVISEDEEITNARLALVGATKIVLKNTLDLMGISAPEKM